MTDFENTELRLDMELLREELAHQRERAEAAEAEVERLQTLLVGRNQGDDSANRSQRGPAGRKSHSLAVPRSVTKRFA